MMPVEFDKDFDRQIGNRVEKKMDQSGYILDREIKLEINRQGLIKSSRYINSIGHEVNKLRQSVRSGTDINDPPYPVYLELGTVKMPAYAPMRKGLNNSKSDINELWSKP